MSASEIWSSKSRTSRNSRSIRPTSRLLKRPVHNDQCTFFSVESLRYWGGFNVRSISVTRVRNQAGTHTLLAHMSAPRKTRSHAHSSRESWRCGLARSKYTRVPRRTGSCTPALSMTVFANPLNSACAERREEERPRVEVEGRPRA